MCEISEARLCRECSLVTTDPECPLCGVRTVRHPEGKRPRKVQYCCQCTDEFNLSDVVVRTWNDDPYDQVDDGMLITVCRTCEAELKAELAD